MRLSNKNITYYIILACSVLFYISFYKGSLFSICLFLSFAIILLNIDNRMMINIVPALLMAIVTLIMLFMSGRMSERGFNAPIGNAQKFVFILFTQCVAIVTRQMEKRKKRTILLVTFSTIAVSCVVSIFYALTQDKYAIRYFEDRGFTNVMDFNQSYSVPFAFTLIFLFLFSAKKIRMKGRVIALAFIVLSAYFAFVSLYTTALMFIAIGMAMCFLVLLHEKSKKTFVGFALLSVFVVAFGVVFRQEISDFLYDLTENLNWIVQARVRDVIDTVFHTDHGNWYNTDRREELANYSLNSFFRHPWFGVGYSGYGYGIIGCHQEWYDMLGVFGLVGTSCFVFLMLFYIWQAYKYAESQMDKNALLISVTMFAILGFLNPCLSKQGLFLVFVIAPNLSSLIPEVEMEITRETIKAGDH